MNDRGKSALSLSILALIGLTLTCDAYASSNRSERRTIKEVRFCVSEIAKHADYDEGSRVIHWVSKFTQPSLVELEIHIETTVYGVNDDLAIRRYKSSCLLASMGNLSDFRIDAIQLDSVAQN